MSTSSRLSTNPLISGISCPGLTLSRQQLSTLPARVQKSVHKALAGFCDDARVQEIFSQPGVRNPVSLHLEGGRLLFKSSARTRQSVSSSVRALDFPKVLSALSELKDVARLHAPEAVRDSTPFRYDVKETRPKEAPEFFGVEASEVTADINDLLRNSLAIAGRGADFIEHSEILDTGLGVIGGFYKVHKHTSNGYTAKKCNDQEGIVQAGLLGSAATTGLMSTGSRLAFGTATNLCGLGASGMVLASAIHSLDYLPSFRSDLRAILEKKDIPLHKKAEQGIIFLQQQIALTEADLREIALKHPTQTQRDVAKTQKLQEKWDRFVRRVGGNCAQKVALDSARLLEEARAGITANAMELLQLANSESLMKMTVKVFLLCVAILGTIASLLSIIATAPISASVVFALSSIGALTALLVLFIDSSHIQDKYKSFIASL